LLATSTVTLSSSQEELSLDTVDGAEPATLKAFLDANAIEYEADTPVTLLKVLVRRRFDRRQRETARKAAHGRVFNVHGCLGVKELIKLSAMNEERGIHGAVFKKVKFVLDDVSDEHTKVQHHAFSKEDANVCRGKVVDGVCQTCYTSTPGVVSFGFKLVMRDFNDPTCILDRARRQDREVAASR